MMSICVKTKIMPKPSTWKHYALMPTVCSNSINGYITYLRGVLDAVKKKKYPNR